MNPIGHYISLERIQHRCFLFNRYAVAILAEIHRKNQSEEVQR
jgi:hypothetical protein